MDTEYFFIRNRINGLVLDAAGPVPSDSSLADVVVGTMSGADSQLWTFDPGGFVRNKATGGVLDIDGAGPIGSRLLTGGRNQTLPNSASSNQQWNLNGRGRFISRFNQSTLGVDGGEVVPGARVVSEVEAARPTPEGQYWTRWFAPAA